MTFRTPILAAMGFVAAFLTSQVPAAAQVLYGSIVGQASDPSNAAIPEATVIASNKATGRQLQTTTNDAGQYSFVALQPGIYEIKISKDGFRTLTNPDVEVTANNVTRIDLTMQVGSVSEAVTVEASSAVLQTDSATVRAEVTSREMLNVPVPVGRNYQNLFVTIPGFSPPRNAHSVPTNPARALEANVNGAPRSGVNIRIDGASSQQTWLPHIAAYVPAIEAIDTVNVVTTAFRPSRAWLAALQSTCKSRAARMIFTARASGITPVRDYSPRASSCPRDKASRNTSSISPAEPSADRSSKTSCFTSCLTKLPHGASWPPSSARCRLPPCAPGISAKP